MSGEPRRFQRFAAYGLVTEPNGRVLLTLIADGYPGAGRWHLPGGGTDFGEAAADGLRREIVEETGQKAEITGLLSASHRYRRSAIGPGGCARRLARRTGGVPGDGRRADAARGHRGRRLDRPRHLGQRGGGAVD